MIHTQAGSQEPPHADCLYQSPSEKAELQFTLPRPQKPSGTGVILLVDSTKSIRNLTAEGLTGVEHSCGPLLLYIVKGLADLQCKSCGLYSLITLSVNYVGADLRVKFPNVGLRASLQPGDVEKRSQACCVQCPSAVTRLVSFSADSTRSSSQLLHLWSLFCFPLLSQPPSPPIPLHPSSLPPLWKLGTPAHSPRPPWSM